MRSLAALFVLTCFVVPSSIASAQPPVVVIGAPPATSGPPPDATPAVPPGYELEGELGGLHFHARVTTPAPQPAPVAPAPPPPAPAPPVVVAPPPAAPPPVMTVQPAPQPTYVPQPTYAQPTYAQPTYVQQPVYAQPYAQAPYTAQPRDARPRLDTGMDFGSRLAFDVLGAGIGFGLSVGVGYLVNDNSRDSEFMVSTLLTSAGLVPTGVSVFGGAIAGGRGRFGGAMLGELVGGALATLVLVGGDIHLQQGWEQLMFIAAPAILGAIIGFEAQHGLRTMRLERRLEREQQQQGVQLSGISVAPLSQGNGAMAGISGTF